VYGAAALAAGGVDVDVLDRLPAPFGLVRYGVAPDHPKIKSISQALRKVLLTPGVRFLGNVEVGRDVTLEELREHYEVVLVAVGAAVDRRLGVPGEDLPGSTSATEFVAWYNGHPDVAPDAFRLDAESVAVIGLGNVALDVARILARAPEDLARTDVPEHVLRAFEASRVREIHIVGRRGPAQAKFTTKELREFGEVPGVDILVDPTDLDLDPASRAVVDTEAGVRRNLDVFTEWAARQPSGAPKRVHLHFWARPVAVLGDDRVSGLRVERCRPDDSARPVPTGTMLDLAVGQVFRSVGYRGLPVPGLPFDPDTGTVPHQAGRVLTQPGAQAAQPGLYVAGWIKRGPTGVVGTNKSDAAETVASILEDLPNLPPARDPDPDGLIARRSLRGVAVVTWAGWEAIEAAEAAAGAGCGRTTVKNADRERLLAVARAAQTGASGASTEGAPAGPGASGETPGAVAATASAGTPAPHTVSAR
jgi:ferredoxin--NADP+ reductase